MNSELYDKKFKLSPEILKYLQKALTSFPHGEGVKRAKFLMKNGEVTYQTLKRLKNFFDYNHDKNDQQYALAGGDLMKDFATRTLSKERDAVDRSKEIKKDVEIDVNLGTKAQQNPRLNENDAVSDAQNDAVDKNAIGIIINNDNQILLLRRSSNTDWHPHKWALVGGKVEDGETPIEACKREIKEETGLLINKFKEKFVIQRSPNNVEHIFIAKYDGEPINVKLNSEHEKYGWYSPEEIYFLNHVPNLGEYINLAFKKYE